MTQFVFQQGSANGGSGTFLSPWNQAAFDSAIAAGTFRVGGADELIIIDGGTDTVVISPVNASGTIFSNGGATAPFITLSDPILTNSVNVNLGGIGTGIGLTNTYLSVVNGSTLTIAARLAGGLAITGFGTVNVTGLQSSLAADLSGISTSGFNISGVLSSNVTFTGNAGYGALSLTGSGVFTVNSTGLQNATTTVASGVTLRSTAGQIAQLSGANISTTGTGSIVLADINSGAATQNLRGLIGASVTVGSAQTFQGDLGTVAVTVANSVTLTIDGTDANVSNASISGEGSVAYTSDALQNIQTWNVLTSGANALDFSAMTGGRAVVNTGSGTDSLTSGQGLDSLTSGTGNDTIRLAVGGNDVIRSGAGADLITNVTGTVNASNNYIEAGGGDDIVNLRLVAASTGANYITDFGGADSIVTGSGADTILSGDSNDTVDGGDGANSIGGGSGNDTLTGGAASDTILGGGGNDTINAGAGSDSISGGNGDDLLQFAGGEFIAGDSIDGGTGTNTVLLTAAAQTIIDSAFAGKLLIQNFTTNNGANNITFGSNAQAAGIVSITGGTAVDTFNASSMSRAVTITAGDDADVITGSSAADSLVGGNGSDTFNFGNGLFVAGETIAGGAGTNVVALTADAQTIADSAFANKSLIQTFTTANGTNNITFGASAQTAGVVSITGGTGTDTLNASALTSATTIAGGAGADTISGGTNTDTITGGDGNDLLTGGAGADRYVQNAGGISTLASGISGVDVDISVGAAVWTFANGVDVVTDFVGGTDEILSSAGGLPGGTNNLLFGQAVDATAVVAGNYVVQGTWNSTAGTFTYGNGADVMFGHGGGSLAVLGNNGTRSLILQGGAAGFDVVGDIV
jgi:Ca2+-binding RTX toxin-like protein